MIKAVAKKCIFISALMLGTLAASAAHADFVRIIKYDGAALVVEIKDRTRLSASIQRIHVHIAGVDVYGDPLGADVGPNCSDANSIMKLAREIARAFKNDDEINPRELVKKYCR